MFTASVKELRSSADRLDRPQIALMSINRRTAAPSAARWRSSSQGYQSERCASTCRILESTDDRGRRVGERHGRVRDDVRSAFALRGESENRSLVFSLLRLRRCRIQVPVSVAKGEYYPTCFAKHLLAQREVGRVCYGDAPFRDGTYWPCGDAHVFFARHLLARRVNVHL